MKVMEKVVKVDYKKGNTIFSLASGKLIKWFNPHWDKNEIKANVKEMNDDIANNIPITMLEDGSVDWDGLIMFE